MCAYTFLMMSSGDVCDTWRNLYANYMYMKKLTVLDWIAFVLLIIGGVNWGLVGALDIDLVSSIFGAMSVLSRAVYILVGLSALYSIYALTSRTQ